ncbi:omega-6-FAD, chloroplast isoform [Monoraphidium neglectum]|uniref:Omega-6-FAD, chloroplast isoform n=1 Tax=Monoraphidium neglectum TaxID=145388 RepID=A0A0D2IV97_9CHLO|nr:omega-6-FAD, chloroplast isoform [Monoraphidium neglectum]KIY91887.1 omega-6-FAD, chloroplast isoform [Monoraphidium neglectum]|eukprot:XP_013890907.1 omega-6-FAD, chloroplast isoform [Monoraphidium neglectum]
MAAAMQTSRQLTCYIYAGLPLLAPRSRPQVARKAAAIQVPIMELSDADRAQMAKELGYIQIGREVPSSYSLTDVVKSMPQE